MKKMKKGFTIVELVIVIAVIAILAGVLIPVFSNVVDKANKSKDTQLVRNLNEALAVDLDEHNTMYDALQAAKEFGYDVDKINASATDREILWDSANDCFVYLDSKTGNWEYIPNTKEVEAAPHQLWMIVDSVPATQTYSLYVGNGFTATDVEVKVGFDVGENDDIAKVTYTGAKEVTIRTNGGTLVVNNGSAEVVHYGSSEVVDIMEAAGQSYHLFGQVGFLKVAKGHVVVENNAEVKALHIADNDATLKIETEAAVEKVTASTGVTIDNTKVEGINPTEVVADVDPEKAQSGSELFAGGFGESYAPYIIETVEQLKNISANYENYAYYKVADGVKTLDCSGVNLINLNGSFDGNGVKLININKIVLFKNIGYNLNDETMTIENFEANIAGAPAFAQQVVNAGTTIFKNIKITGYIEGASNLGSFYRFGAGQAGGADYTVKFVNCQSTANIFTTEGSVGGFVGHAFAGSGYQAYFDVDENCAFTGTVYLAKANQGDEFFGIGGGVITKNGEAYSDKAANRAMLNVVDITLTESGYTTTVFDNVQSIAINIAPQLTAYDENGEIDPNNAGITGLVNIDVLDEISSGDTIKVLDKITELKIVNGANENGYSVGIEDGVLTVYTNRSTNFQTGAIRLEVVQYDNNGSILAIGRIEIGQINK